jgi:Zn-dependent protease with chaperone function
MREEVEALIFGPGLPPGGQRGALVLSSLGIEVSAAGVSSRANVADLSLREVGFNEFGLELAWKDAGESWAAHVLDSKSARRMIDNPLLAETRAASAMKSARRRNSTGRVVGWSIMALIVVLPAILLVMLILNSNAIAGWVTDRIPVEQEMDWGRRAFADMRGSLKLEDGGAVYDAVNSIGQRLTRDSKYKFEFHVVDDKTLNAFAMPGGIVVVNTGLVAATKRPEELAGVLAHEVQHVELRHSIRGMVKDLGLRGLWAFVTGDLGGTLVGQAAVGLAGLKFSRDDESEADARGFEALTKANIDPSGMPAFFKTMSEQAPDAPVGFISTHPLSKDREAALQARVSASTQKFPALEFSTWPPQ